MEGPQDLKTARLQDNPVKFIRNNKTISGRLHDELVMMDIDQGNYFSLNLVATRIWDLLEKDSGINELCIKLIEEYEVDPVRCTKEVADYLNDMVKLGLVLIVEE